MAKNKRNRELGSDGCNYTKMTATIRTELLTELQQLTCMAKAQDRYARALAAKSGIDTAGALVRTLSSIVEEMLEKALPEFKQNILLGNSRPNSVSNPYRKQSTPIVAMTNNVVRACQNLCDALEESV